MNGYVYGASAHVVPTSRRRSGPRRRSRTIASHTLEQFRLQRPVRCRVQVPELVGFRLLRRLKRIGAQRLDEQPAHFRRAGILFQDDLLFPHLSVAGNLLFGIPAAVRSRAARRDLVEQALSEAGLSGYGERDPATLSGGQRARVALMRTLLSQPELLLLDEPFSKLDALLRADFRRFVFEHAQQLQLPTLMVTHDAADAQAAGGPVVVLE